MDEIKTLIQQFMPFAKEQMGFSRPPRLFLRQDRENAANPLGKTGFYDPQGESITIYVTNRHPKDILRSLAHELMHHTQKCNGDFENTEGMGEQGYAQNSPHMRNMEIQAYQASIVFRDWEDSLKETIYYEHLQKGATKAMSTKEWKNGELTTLLSEAWGFNFNLEPLNETGAKDTGASKGDESKTDPGEKDYTTKKGGKTKKGEKAFEDPSKGEKITTSDSNKRGSKKGDEAYVNETINEDDEELEEGGAALRQGNEDRLQQRHAHADRIHEEEEDIDEAYAAAKAPEPRAARLQRAGKKCYDSQGNRVECGAEASGAEPVRAVGAGRQTAAENLNHDAIVAEVSRRVAARLQGSMTDVASTRRAEQNALGGNQVTEKQLRTVARQVVKRLKETKKNG